MFNIVDQAKLFNEFLTPGVLAEVSSLSKLWDRIKKSDKIEADGLYAKQKLLSAGGTSTRASSNSGYPTAKSSTPNYHLVYMKRSQMFSMQFDGFSLELASKKGASMDPQEFEKKGLFINLSDDMSRQLMGDGGGVLAVVNGAVTTSAVVVVSHPLYANATKFLKKDMVIDFYNGGTKQVDSATILSVDSPTQITLTAATSIATGATIRQEDTYTATEGAGLGEMMGIDGIIRATDPPAPNAAAGLQGLLVANDPQWKCYVNTNGSNREISETLIETCFDNVEGWCKPSVLLTTQGVRRAWAAKLVSYKQLPNQKVLWGGWSGLPFLYDGREIPMVTDRFVPDNTLYGIDESMLTLYVTKLGQEITWEKGDSGGILQKVAGKNEYVAEGHIFSNMGTPMRRAVGFRLEKITEV